MKIFDTHCHLQSDVFTDTGKEISDAKNAGVVKLLNNAVSITGWKEVIAISESHNEVLSAIGIHPYYIDRDVKSIESEIKLLDFSKCRAIGEIGLDKKKSTTPIETQIEVFELFLELSHELKIPCSVHCVSAFDELISCLKKFKQHPPVIIHGFSGSIDLARSLSKFGCFFSIGEAVKNRSLRKISEMLNFIYPSLMMFESDSPGNKITGENTHIMRPCFIADYPDLTSKIINIPSEEIAVRTFSLSLDIFGD